MFSDEDSLHKLYGDADRQGRANTSRPGTGLLWMLAGVLGYAFLLWLSLTFLREGNGVAAVTPASAVALAMIMRRPPATWWAPLGACFAATLMVVAVAGGRPQLGVEIAAANMIEVALVAAVLCRWRGARFDFGQSADLAVFACVCMLVPWLTSIVYLLPGGATLQPASLILRAVAHGLGFLVFTPALMLLRLKDAELFNPARRRAALLSGLMLAVALGLVFGQSRYPLLFLALPPIVLMAFLFELEGAAVAILVTTLVSIVSAYEGRGPLALITGSMTERILVLQLFLATSSLLVLPVGSALSQRRAVLRSVGGARDEALDAHASAREMQQLATMAEKLAGVAYWRRNPVTGEAWWSQQMYELVGFPSEAGVPSIEATLAKVHPADRDRLRAAIEGLMREGAPVKEQVTLERQNGDRRVIRVQAEAEQTPGGGVGSVFGAFLDVTDVHRTEAALSESEARFRSWAENSDDVVVHTALDGRLSYVSPSVERVAGWRPEEMIGRSFESLTHPDDSERVRKEVVRRLKAADDAPQPPIEYRVICKNGETIWVEAKPKFLIDPMSGLRLGVTDVIRNITDRKRQETLFRQAVESAPNAMVMIDAAGRIDMVNALAERTFGYERGELLGQAIEILVPERFQVHHPGLRDSFFADPRSRAMGAGGDLFGLRKDGTEFPIEIGLNPIETDEGPKVISAIVDITDRKEAEERVRKALAETEEARAALARSEGDYRMLAEHSSDIVIRTDPSGVITYCSPAVRQQGFTPEEIVGTTALNLSHPDDISAALARRAQNLSGAPIDPTVDRHQRLRTKSGEYRWFEGAPSVLRDEEGKVIAVINSLRDIHQRKQMEQDLLAAKVAAEAAAEDAEGASLAMAESEARYRMLAEHSSDIIIRYGPDGTIRYASPAVTALGYSPEEVRGRKTLEFIHADDRPEVMERQRRLFAGQLEPEALNHRIRFVHRSGEFRWFDAARSVVRDDAGQITEVISALRDVEERTKIEVELVAAKEKAEAAAQAKSDFLANMSHELRTPLTAIIGFAGLLGAKGKLGEMEAKFVERIVKASRNLLTLINEVLDISKVDAGLIVLERVPTPLRALAEDAVQLFGEQARAKGLELRAEIGVEVPDQVFADPVRLAQILANLLGNAVKFTAAGGVTLRIMQTSSKRLRFEVSDTGEGIAVDRVDKLFVRFVQADSSTTRNHGGTGLGLAICKGLVDLMDGQIGIQSFAGEGSTFWFEIPLTEISDASPRPGDQGERHPIAHLEGSAVILGER
ncbi:PAS domain S-box protein [Phenylobacterium sp.]|uniref:PAS domain S-box protein n=1 Tax=Phenylobacterium sp. TaxID=1871053 RepID=UPI0027257770|nr:PAS domain S-box protein [Phenylobacterium sp.]MDO8801083.1 PAS domain S-box protein [Phenylobacterium sp.]